MPGTLIHNMQLCKHQSQELNFKNSKQDAETAYIWTTIYRVMEIVIKHFLNEKAITKLKMGIKKLFYIAFVFAQ